MSEKNISECLQCQFPKVQGKCCEGHGYGILASTGSWKQLDSKRREKKNLLAQFRAFKSLTGFLHYGQNQSQNDVGNM